VVITVPLEAVYVHDPSGFTVAPVATSFTFERGRLSPALLSSVKPRGSFPSAASGVVAKALAEAVDDAPACGELLDAEEHALNPRSRQAPAHNGATIRRDLNI